MRRLAIITMLVLWYNCAGAQPSSAEKMFEETVNDIVTKIATHPIALNKYIDSKTGLFVIYRNGVFDEYINVRTLDFSTVNFPRHILPVKTTPTPLDYNTAADYDCDKGKWIKEGLFTDTSEHDHLLSKTATDRKVCCAEVIPKKLIARYYDLELASRRIVLASNDGEDLIFYLSFIDGKWCLVMIDKLSTDCSV